MDENCPKLIVEELPPNVKLVDDAASIKSYDVNDNNDLNNANNINVNYGRKDASGAHIDAYNAFNAENFGYFPSSISGDEKMKKPNKTMFEKALERIPGSFCNDELPAYGKQMYTVTNGVSYAILTTPVGKLIRIGDKIVPLPLFLQFNCIEQAGDYVHCSNHLYAKNVHSFKISIDDLETILLHVVSLAPNNVHVSCFV